MRKEKRARRKEQMRNEKRAKRNEKREKRKEKREKRKEWDSIFFFFCRREKLCWCRLVLVSTPTLTQLRPPGKRNWSVSRQKEFVFFFFLFFLNFLFVRPDTRVRSK
jgi:hypothetical protein